MEMAGIDQPFPFFKSKLNETLIFYFCSIESNILKNKLWLINHCGILSKN